MKVESQLKGDETYRRRIFPDSDEVRFRKLNTDDHDEPQTNQVRFEPEDQLAVISKLRRTLAHGHDDSDEDEKKFSCGMDVDLSTNNLSIFSPDKRTKKCFAKKLKFNEVSATNLKIRTGVEAGLWDKWGLYYCSSRYGRNSGTNHSYFALAALFIMGQGSMLNLIYFMNQHGGAAFLVVLALVYISVGFPLYIFETGMGQYSGRKPLQMIRYMLPALTGIGPALYLRTVVKAVNSLGIFLYSAYLVFALFFCKPTEISLIHRFLEVEKKQKIFNVFEHRISEEINETVSHAHLYRFWWLIFFTVALFVLVVQRIKLLGQIMARVVRLFLLAMCGYLIVGSVRVFEAKPGSIVYLPITTTLTPDWWKLFKGQAWLDAMIFVIESMELGTLVHPYLGSRSFFHYRNHRDGLYLTLLAMVWNIGTAVAALLWLGYIGANAEQITVSTENLFGHYGLFIVFMLKHMQAEMTGNVQGDVLFFNAFFYSIIGLAGICATVVHIIILVDSSVTESGHLIVKVLIMVIMVIFFGLAVPIFLLQDEGLRYLIFINFYVHKSWSAFFIVACYFSAVAFGHDMGKFVHDFLNIVHIKGYQSRQHSYHVPRALRYLVLIFLGIGMICYVFARPYPHEGQTDWTHNGKFVGIIFSLLPLLTVLSVFLYYRAQKNGEPFKPHRDWYKNKHHTAVCFADFAHFKGITELEDPKIEDRKQRKSRKSQRLSQNPAPNTTDANPKPEDTTLGLDK